ncbi:UPF0149 family protein [Herbaspirillum sp. C9C3]|uniref:UPF0149 family protein n=2 Tax=Pseudomonadota TaxID=1224 RepID=UPI00201CA8D6|nr:UPF0149 family protein [Herbaspirillum sp. C9C3]
MTITVLKLSDADAYLKNISIKTIKDVRALDVDLMLILMNGDRIIINNGAVSAMSAPESSLQFADGKLPLASVFQQIDKIDVSPEANLTVSSKEITRYNQNNAKNKKARKDEEEDGDKPVVVEPGERDPAVATDTHGSGGNTERPNFTPTKSPDNQSQIADAEINSQNEKNWGVQWPIAAGALALLAAAGGGGGGGGGGGSSGGGGGAANGNSGGAGAGAGAAAGSGAGTADPSASDLRGSVALGAIQNANITAYDALGNALSETVAVVDGKYTLKLNRALYKGPMLLVVRDNTPGLADNFIDEGTRLQTDLGTLPLRAAVVASGGNQTVNVTALTELALLKAGLDQGVLRLADQPEVNAQRIIAANNAVSGFFKVDALATEVVVTTVAAPNGRPIANPNFNSSLGTETQNYGAALKAIANLVRLDKKTYPDQATVLDRLSKALQFVEEAGGALKWATNSKGQTLASASAMQAALLSESLTATLEDPNTSGDAVNTAQQTLDALQNLPTGTTVADYLISNHVAIPNPVITIRNAVVGNAKPWQTAPFNETLVLDQGDFLDGDLRVKTTPNAKVQVIINGRDVLGRELSISLPAAHADGEGSAILHADTESMDLLYTLDREHSVIAQVTVTDGNNSRTNHGLWSISSNDVRVDLNTPADMTRFVAQNPLTLVSDSFYNDPADPGRFPATQGNQDGITKEGKLRITLNKELDSTSERLQVAVATGADSKGNPIWDIWREVNATSKNAPAGVQGFIYETGQLTEANGDVWVKARVVQKGQKFTGGYGNANTLETPLYFKFDNVAPDTLPLRLVSGRDDGISGSDGITSQTGSMLELASPREAGAELHFQLQAGTGTGNNALAIRTSNESGAPTVQPVAPGNWITLKANQSLIMQGDTKEGNGKVVLKLRHIDAAGNYSEHTQTFITDTTGTIERAVLLVQRNNAVLAADAAVTKAKAEYDVAGLSEKSAKLAVLSAAQRVQLAAKAAHEKAIIETREALSKVAPGIGMPLDALLVDNIDSSYLSAIVNQLSRVTEVDKINHQAGLKTFVDEAIRKASDAVTKASLYLPVIFGGEPAFDSEDHACTVLSLIMRHWNTISSALHRTMRQGGIYLPVLMVDEHGMVGGNDWAWGFMRGVRCRPAGWHTLMETEEMSECMLAIMVLLHEHSPDPATRPPAISADCREELLHTMMTDLTQIYRHFAPQRQQSYGLPMHCKGFVLDDERACPCGSGQKYKYCCAVRTPTLH